MKIGLIFQNWRLTRINWCLGLFLFVFIAFLLKQDIKLVHLVYIEIPVIQQWTLSYYPEHSALLHVSMWIYLWTTFRLCKKANADKICAVKYRTARSGNAPINSIYVFSEPSRTYSMYKETWLSTYLHYHVSRLITHKSSQKEFTAIPK